MKRTLLATAILLVFAFALWATSFHTIGIDGTNDFASDEDFTTSTGGYTAYFTWDASNVYLGYTGSDVGSSESSTKWMVWYFDVDPQPTPASGNGTTDAISFNTQDWTLPFNADYMLQIRSDEGFNQLNRWNGSSWVNAGATFGSAPGDIQIFDNDGANFIEVRVPKSALSGPCQIYVLSYFLNEMAFGEFTFASWPDVALSGGDGYYTAGSFIHWYGYDVSASGISPDAPANFDQSISLPVTNLNTGKRFCTIQAAVNDATTLNGHTIDVAAGTYVENVTINKSLTLQGVDPGVVANSSDLLTAGVLQTVVQAASPSAAVFEITSTFTGLTIKNIRAIGHTGAGVMKLATAGTASNFAIDKVAFDGGERAIYSTGPLAVTNVSVTNSAFRGSTKTASGLELWVTASGLTVTNNYITFYRDGMNLSNVGGVTPPVGGTSVVSLNKVEDIGDSGIQVAIGFSDLTISENTVLGPNSEAGVGEGIQIESAGPSTSIKVFNNVIQDGDNGLVFSNLGSSTTVMVSAKGNVITGNTGAGVIATSSVAAANIPGLHINDNFIESNGFGAQNAVASTVLDCSANWWGTNTASGVDATVDANVDYTPWLNAGTDDDLGTAGFQGDFSFLNVDDDSPQSGVVGHIQEGINLVTASTVNILPGIYTVPAIVTFDNLTLQGAGIGLTIIQGDGTTCTTAGIAFSGSRSNVTIADMTITGWLDGIQMFTGPISNILIEDVETHSNCRHGIWSQAFGINGLTVRRVMANNNNLPPYAQQFGRGIWIINGVKQNITIEDGFFNNNRLVGIDVSDGNVTDLTISGNDVIGNGDSGIGVLGPQGPGATLVTTNTVTDNGRFGIEIKNPTGNGADSGPGSVVVFDNVVSRTVAATDARDYCGIAVFRRSPVVGSNADQPSGVVVKENDVTGYRRAAVSTGDGFGIVIEGANHTVDGNTVTNCDVGIQTQAGNPSINAQSTPYFDRGDASTTGSASVTNNTVNTNDNGVRTIGPVTGSVTLNVIHNNSITGVTILDEASTGVLFNYNQICLNSTFGMENLGTTTVNAENNWWGTLNGPTHASNPGGTGDAVSDRVDFTPFDNVGPSSGPCPAPTPPMADAGEDRTICSGQSTTLGNTPAATGGTPPYSFLWSAVPPDPSLTSPTDENPTVSSSVTTTYTLTVTDDNGLMDTDDVVVTVNPLPVVDAGADRSICIGETITLGGSPTASGNGPFTYSWDPTTGLDDPASANPTVRPTSGITYTVTVTDANGCEASDEVTISVHEYVFLSDDYVKINKNRASDGNIHSNEKIEFGAGYPGTHTGNLTALDDITIKTKNTIVGDATAGDELYLFGTADVTGTENEHAIVTAIPMPSITFSVGGPNQTVPKNGSFTLPTGSYGKVKVNSNATLYLSSGDYFMNILDTESSAKLSCDVTNGPVNIHVMSDLDLATKVQVLITGAGAATDQVSFITLQDPKVDIGKQAIIRGAIIAQNAEVHFSQGCKFRGSICADGITLDADVKFQFHTSGAPFPKPSELENLDDEDTIEAAEVVVTEYQLQQNYPNPFNPSTKIAFSVKEAGRVELAIYNLQGQLVRKLISREMNVGHHEIMWNGRDEAGQMVHSGIYLYKLRVNGFEETRKMTFMK